MKKGIPISNNFLAAKACCMERVFFTADPPAAPNDALNSLRMTNKAPSDEHRHNTERGFIAAGCVVLFWSGFNIVSRMAGKSALTPFDLVALRFGVSSLIMLPFLIRRRTTLAPRQWLVVSGIGGLLYSITVYSGFTFAPAAHAGILVNGGIPFATAMFAWVVLGFRPNRRVVMAFSLTAVGIGLISIRSLMMAGTSSERWWLGDLFFIIAAMSWGFYGVLLRKWQLPAVDAIAALTCGAAAVYFPVYLLFLPKAISKEPWHTILLQGGYQGIVAALGAGLGFAYATQTIGPIRASLMLALVPGISIMMAVPLLGEPLTLATIAGFLCVTVGSIWGAVANAPVAARQMLQQANQEAR
jgi:drug/metabolite transporter (DMT)-like permease